MTIAPRTLVVLQAKLVKNLHTRNLGIVGDDEHVRTGGYHIGAKTLRRNGMSHDYSLEFHLDTTATHDFSCAIDIGGSASTLMKLGNRIVHAMKNHDPRVKGRIRAVNAPFDGVTADRRRDDENPNTTKDDQTQSSSDRGHIHVEFYRSLVLNQSVMDGFYEVMAGVPLAKSKVYRSRPAPKPIAKPVAKPVRKPPAKPASARKYVVVRSGQTLDWIARHNHTTWQRLQKLNNLKNPNRIAVGQKLRVK